MKSEGNKADSYSLRSRISKIFSKSIHSLFNNKSRQLFGIKKDVFLSNVFDNQTTKDFFFGNNEQIEEAKKQMEEAKKAIENDFFLGKTVTRKSFAKRSITLKTDNVTMIRLKGKGVALYLRNQGYVGEGGNKRFRKALWISLDKNNIVSVENVGLLKYSKSSQEMSKAKDLLNESQPKLNPLPQNRKGIMNIHAAELYTSHQRLYCENERRPPVEKLLFITELGEKGDLRKHLTSESLRREEKIILGRQIIESIHSLHKIGMVHRDIKLDNFFIKDEGSIILGDSDSVLNIKKMKGQKIEKEGTRSYFSPEYFHWYGTLPQTDLMKLQTPKMFKNNDIWGLGIVLLSVFGGIKENDVYFERSDLGTAKNIVDIGTRGEGLANDWISNREEALTQYPKEFTDLLREMLSANCNLTAKKILSKFNEIFSGLDAKSECSETTNEF